MTSSSSACSVRSTSPIVAAGRSLAVLAAIAVAVFALIGYAKPSGAATPPAHRIHLGISSNYQWASNLPNAAHDVPELQRAGITGLREDIFWDVVQPNSASQWNWAQYDRYFTTMARLHMRVLPIISYGTTWASPDGNIQNLPSTAADQRAYARFAAAVVTRYGPSGRFWRTHPSLKDPLPIRSVELWNEPWLAPNPSVTDYVAILRLAGAAVHRVDHSILVAANVDDRWTHLTDSDTPYWGQAVLEHARELAPYINRWAIHPYSEGQWTGLSPSDDAMRQVQWLQAQLAQVHARGYIWVTEIGFSTIPPPSNSAGFSTYQTPSTSYRLFLSALTHTAGPNPVTSVWIFTSARPTSSTKPGSWDYGYNLVRADGALTASVTAASQTMRA